MNMKVLGSNAYYDGKSVIDDSKIYNKANLVVYGGKKYAMNPNAIFTVNCTAKCNANCYFCYNGTTFMRDDAYVSADTYAFERASDFARLGGIRIAALTGGEPSLNAEKLLAIVRKLKQKGFETVRLHTNGVLLHNEIVVDGELKPLWQWLDEYGLDDLSISLADYRSERCRSIMKIDSVRKVEELLPCVTRTRLRVRLSCYLCEQGVYSLKDIRGYVSFARSHDVRYIIFRLSPRNDREDRIYLENIVKEFFDDGWSLVFEQHKSDSTIYELTSGEEHIALSCVSEEKDPDRKIRRLIYMPDQVVYTSWIDPSSYLFDDDAEKIACADNNSENQGDVGNYPARVWKKRIPEHICEKTDHDIDLHVHSLVSDGLLTPTQVLESASKSGIRTLVFTEHNCLHDNVDLLRKTAAKYGIEMPLIGVEFSTVYCKEKKPQMKFHLLIYGKRPEQFVFMDSIYNPNEPRNQYIYGLYMDLKKKGILHAGWDEIYGIKDDNAPTKKKMIVRTPLAEAIARENGISAEEAKKLYLPQMPEEDRYRYYLDTEEVIQLAHENGCATVLAHPGWIRAYNKTIKLDENDLFIAITELARRGLDGIEIVHRLNNMEMRKKLYYLAMQLNLSVTGGSDYHGKPRCVWSVNGSSQEELDNLMVKIK